MKRISFILVAAALVVLGGCKNQNKKQDVQVQTNPNDPIVLQNLQISAANLVESTKEMKRIPIINKTPEGKIVLTDSEKKVKPDFLLDPAIATKYSDLSHKYRVTFMLATDLAIANLYEMPANDYKNALNTLLVDIQDDALTLFAQTPWMDAETVKEALSFLVEDEYKNGRPNFFWEGTAAGMVEQLYFVTRDIDKYIKMFDDQSAADVTYNFVCVHEGLKSLSDLYPEMDSLNEVLTPLYVINAINVEQLKEQLTTLKGDIEYIREAVLK